MHEIKCNIQKSRNKIDIQIDPSDQEIFITKKPANTHACTPSEVFNAKIMFFGKTERGGHEKYHNYKTGKLNFLKICFFTYFIIKNIGNGKITAITRLFKKIVL